ncbi:MAG TPA: primosomal protein N' [Candidatus Saccharimonadales bacterium]|nr:primosomal protein N' [Candidatus Saccharimonadales bacterium]
MYFYQVWVRSNHFHGNEALTYQSPQRLAVGTVVSVPLQREQVLAVITKATMKPTFTTKHITKVHDVPTVPQQVLQLGEWLKAYYPAPLGLIAQHLLPAHVHAKDTTEQLSIQPPHAAGLPTLTIEQTNVLEHITGPDTYLLHGRTGSGKTRIYIELALRTITENRSCIILTPEISLTSQLATQFRNVFGKRVIVLHSQLTPKERRLTWLNIVSATEPLIVIGPRSALFSPLRSIGLIVLDEAHEPAYKQEQAPHYLASRVAGKLAGLHKAVLVLGSATPLITDYFVATQKHKPILELSTLAQSTAQYSTRIEVVDLKERTVLGRSTYLSQPLLTHIETALLKKEQVLLYLNRRGTARIILCENCGWQALCPHCDVPLTYHGDSHELRCHVCNYHESAPNTCPVCGHPNIIFRAVGTKAVAADIARLFPGARVQRFDADNQKAERFEQHYEAIHAGEVDILVGTQLLAKGLDLPRLSTLGIINADTSLSMPDFSSNERTYQLLKQVLGRVGRGHIAATAIIQTYQPDHPAIRAAIEDDWTAFYRAELESRQLYNFPPFCYLLKLVVRRASAARAEKAAEAFAETIRATGIRVRIEGPAPSFYEKFQNKYQWQLVIKANERSQLLKVINILPKSNWSYDIDPINLL